MPRSKRDREISLTKVKKKGMAIKEKLIKDMRESLENFENVFVFSVENMRNNKLKEIKSEWKDSRFYFGRNKVMALALGRIKEEETGPGLHKVSKRLVGQTGVLYTNRTQDDVISHFAQLHFPEYARSGNVAPETITLPAGPLHQFPHSIEPQLRQLGMPTSLEKGVVTLLREFVVCEKGKAITPEQARILKLLGYELMDFHLTLLCVWSKDGKFVNLQKPTGKSPAKDSHVLPIKKRRLRQSAVCENEGDEEVDSAGETINDDVIE